MATRVKRPATKTAPEPTPKSEASLQPAHVRVPDESQPLLKGLIANLLILGVALGVTLPFALNPKTATIGWIIFGIVMLWIIGPYFWLLARMSTITAAWKKLAAEGSNQIIPDTRQNPQAMMNDICRAVPLASIPTAILVPGDEPAIISVGSQVLITEAMYRQTRDHHLQWLLQHEVGHHFAGHISLGALAAAVPPTESEGPVRLLMLPIMPLVLALEEWALWADVTADRLALVLNPDFNLASMGVLQQVILTYPEGPIRTRISHFLEADGRIDPGEQVGVNQAINDLLFARHDAESRITNLREWREHASYREAVQSVRDRLGSLPGAQAPAPAEHPAEELVRPRESDGRPQTLNLTPVEPEPVPSTPSAAAQAPLSHEGALNMPLQRLAELGLTLPAPPQPLGVYVPAVRTGNLLFLCGQLPLVGGKLPSEFTGKVGASVPVERAQQAARQAALNALAIIHDTIGLQRVKQIVRLTGYVSSASSFTQQPVVLNGASELLAGVFSDAGKHARVAIGVAVLPMDACIEVDIIVEVE